jgi:hypothetical protein
MVGVDRIVTAVQQPSNSAPFPQRKHSWTVASLVQMLVGLSAFSLHVSGNDCDQCTNIGSIFNIGRGLRRL